ncbi:hypothetical protein BO71DRAFT_397170 [Aspergillus ellipticus CBS 707.79]|uniref:Uncharacterized protein n=1 Tax=Aspergillus ellipticus CBS 707.79 TaxID=1448320 RepID=A0A319E6R6_9EURO|nr:hypothetical protein BO71DRAFT_397170 [Aspergillus ellipticus CBS 707.79]
MGPVMLPLASMLSLLLTSWARDRQTNRKEDSGPARELASGSRRVETCRPAFLYLARRVGFQHQPGLCDSWNQVIGSSGAVRTAEVGYAGIGTECPETHPTTVVTVRW